MALKLFMVLLGCSPAPRNTEQHDVFFGIAHELKELVPAIYDFWPEAKTKLHIDGWREVTQVDDYDVNIVTRQDTGRTLDTLAPRLFFINLGGYKKDELEEFHYKMLAAGTDKGMAIQQAKQTAFYRHTGYKGASSHIDDKYGIDVDDVYEITDILPEATKQRYAVQLVPATVKKTDEITLGYFKLDKL